MIGSGARRQFSYRAKQWLETTLKTKSNSLKRFIVQSRKKQVQQFSRNDQKSRHTYTDVVVGSHYNVPTSNRFQPLNY